MAERKPWEETWATAFTDKVSRDDGQSFDHELRVVGDDWPFGRVADDHKNGLRVPNPEDAARAQLAAAAPEMARVLLAIEWGPMFCCPVCRRAQYVSTNDGAREQGHAPDCALDAALRKAGVR